MNCPLVGFRSHICRELPKPIRLGKVSRRRTKTVTTIIQKNNKKVMVSHCALASAAPDQHALAFASRLPALAEDSHLRAACSPGYGVSRL
jgi:hypothetical protein